MAGYLFNLDEIESLAECIRVGIYSTNMKSHINGRWQAFEEATFADYVTMQAGDNVYFFTERKIYGVGELINVGGNSCVYSNHPDSCNPNTLTPLENELLLGTRLTADKQRWICTFKPAPYFFKSGIDMDELLLSDPVAFKVLRTFWKRSFIKFDDEENQAFKSALLRKNYEAMTAPIVGENVFSSDFSISHNAISHKITRANHELKIEPFLESCADGDQITHEMAIEAAFLFQLSHHYAETVNVFGNWDYLSHQVAASPFKPIDYMDRIDAFGYSMIAGHHPTRIGYMVVEMKKDEGNSEDIDQIMKYVDWVKSEYCHGSYQGIKAFLVTYEFDETVKTYCEENGKRQYAIGSRPPVSMVWNDLKLIQYRYDSVSKRIRFTEI